MREDDDAISRLRSNLLSVISHELNTPLTVIFNSLTMLEEKYPREGEHLPTLRRNAERLRKTVQNIMQLAQSDAGAMRVRLSEVDFRNFLLLRKERLKPELEKEKFLLEMDLEDDIPNVCADAKRLARAFDSLVLNAVKFSNQEKSSPAERKIRVRMYVDGEDSIPAQCMRDEMTAKTALWLFVSVSSSLPALGEVPENFEQLFEPFSPWRDAGSRVHEGLGVELALAREILLAHQGNIWAEKPEKTGEGWVFRFAIPVLSRLDELDLVINNRLFGELSSLSKLSLLVIRPEPGTMTKGDGHDLGKTIEKILFRSSDSFFWVPEVGELTVLMDDCDAEGAQKVSGRLIKLLKQEKPKMGFVWSTVTAPDDGSDAHTLLQVARSRWQPSDFT